MARLAIELAPPFCSLNIKTKIHVICGGWDKNISCNPNIIRKSMIKMILKIQCNYSRNQHPIETGNLNLIDQITK